MSFPPAISFSEESMSVAKCAHDCETREHPYESFEYNVPAEVLGGGLKDSDCQTSDCQHSSSRICGRVICHVEIGSASGGIKQRRAGFEQQRRVKLSMLSTNPSRTPELMCNRDHIQNVAGLGASSTAWMTRSGKKRNDYDHDE
jgi:hypothetical protein